MDSTQTRETEIARAEPAVGTFIRIFNLVFSRHVMNIAVLIVVPMAFSSLFNFNLLMVADADLWWHLADARYITTTHHMIWIDPYSFTAAGQRWLDWEWLAEIPLWIGFKAFGLQGIYLVTRLALYANVLAIYWRSYRKSSHAGVAFWVAGLAFILMVPNSGPRTIAFGYLAMSAELAILDAALEGKKKLLWLLPPLFALWVNLHGSWIIGLGLFGLYIFSGLFSLKVGAFDQMAFTAKERNQLLAIFGVSTVALLANPYGWHLLWNPIDMMFNQKLTVATIAEWQPLSPSSFEGKGAVASIILMVVANLVSGRKWKVYELVFVVFAWYVAFSHHRFTYLAAVITIPMLAMDLKRAFFSEADGKTIPVMNALMAAGAICVILVTFPSEASLREAMGKIFPLQTIGSIEPSWRTLNGDYVGGLMDFNRKPSFMDSRFDSFEHNGVLSDYFSINQGQNALALMDKYRVDHALLLDSAPIVKVLQQTGWRVEQREKVFNGEYLLFARDSGAVHH